MWIQALKSIPMVWMCSAFHMLLENLPARNGFAMELFVQDHRRPCIHGILEQHLPLGPRVKACQVFA